MRSVPISEADFLKNIRRYYTLRQHSATLKLYTQNGVGGYCKGSVKRLSNDQLFQQIMALSKYVIEMTLDSLILSGHLKPEDRTAAVASAHRRVCDRLMTSTFNLLK